MYGVHELETDLQYRTATKLCSHASNLRLVGELWEEEDKPAWGLKTWGVVQFSTYIPSVQATTRAR